MGDKGAEIFKEEVQDLCQLHGINYTNTTSHAHQQNEFVERGHAVADRALERMLTADPSLRPQVALAWVIYAANTLQNVNGCVPFQLVFGRIPKHPSLVDDNPGANEVIADSQAQWAQHYRTMMIAREHNVAAEADPALREALRQKIHTKPARVSKGDWIYFRKISDKYWKGPAKVVSKESESRHCIMRGNPLIINIDDIHINKPNAQEMELEDLIYLPTNQQPCPAMPDRHGKEEEDETTEQGVAWEVPTSMNTGSASVPQNYDTQKESEQVLQGGTEAISKVSQFDNNEQLANSDTLHEKPGPQPSKPLLLVPTVHGHDDHNKSEERWRREAGETIQDKEDSTSHQDQPTQATAVEHQATSSQESPDSQQGPANSTLPINLGFPIQCNLCNREISSKNFFRHCSTDHNIERPNFRQHAMEVSSTPES